MMLEDNKRTVRTIKDFGITQKQIKNLVDNKTDHLIGAKAKNLKILFEYILNYSLTTVNLSAVEQNNITVEDFLSLARKMKINKELINKAHNNYINPNIEDSYSQYN